MAAPTISGAQLTDTFASVSSRTTASINYTSAVANLVLVVAIGVGSTNNTPVTVTSMSDSLGLTWVKAGAVSKTGATRGITSSPKAHNAEIWYAVSVGTVPATGHTITANFSATIDNGIMLVTRMSGCNLTNPIDANGALPASSTYDSASALALALSGINTNTANTLIYAIASSMGAGNNNSSVTLSGGTGVFGGGTFHNTSGLNFIILNQVGKGFTSVQTGVSAASSAAVNEGQMLAIAFTADSQVNLAARPYAALMG